MSARLATTLKSAKRRLLLLCAVVYAAGLVSPLVVFAPPRGYTPPPAPYRPPANDNYKPRPPANDNNRPRPPQGSSGGARPGNSSGQSSVPQNKTEVRQAIQTQVKSQIAVALSRTQLVKPSPATSNQRPGGTGSATNPSGKPAGPPIKPEQSRKVREIAASLQSKIVGLANLSLGKVGDKSALASGSADKSVAIDRSRQLASKLPSGSKLREVFSAAAKKAESNQSVAQKLEKLGRFGKAAKGNGLSRSNVVSAQRAEQLLVKYGYTADQAKKYVASFSGPIRARIASPGESFLRYTDGVGSKGHFLTKSEFKTPAEAVKNLYLEPFGNRASLMQRVTASRRSIILEGEVANGSAKQSVIVNQKAFQFEKGMNY